VRAELGDTLVNFAVASYYDPNFSAVGDYDAIIQWGDETPASAGRIEEHDGVIKVFANGHEFDELGSVPVQVAILQNNTLQLVLTAMMFGAEPAKAKPKFPLTLDAGVAGQTLDESSTRGLVIYGIEMPGIFVRRTDSLVGSIKVVISKENDGNSTKFVIDSAVKLTTSTKAVNVETLRKLISASRPETLLTDIIAEWVKKENAGDKELELTFQNYNIGTANGSFVVAKSIDQIDVRKDVTDRLSYDETYARMMKAYNDVKKLKDAKKDIPKDLQDDLLKQWWKVETLNKIGVMLGGVTVPNSPPSTP